MSSADLELLGGAVPLVRDEPWQWFVMFWDDPAETVPSDLSGTTVTAEIRWQAGEQTVTVEATDPGRGQFKLMLDAEDTVAMPLGRLSMLYLAVDTDTEAVVPVDVLQGMFP